MPANLTTKAVFATGPGTVGTRRLPSLNALMGDPLINPNRFNLGWTRFLKIVQVPRMASCFGSGRRKEGEVRIFRAEDCGGREPKPIGEHRGINRAKVGVMLQGIAVEIA